MLKVSLYKRLYSFYFDARCVYLKSRWMFWICIAVVVFSLPSHNGEIGSGLDASWIDFLNFAPYKGAVWGENVFFTYGPLGFLEYTRNVGYNLLISNFVWLVIYLIHIRVIFCTACKVACTRLNLIMATVGAILYSFSGSTGSLYICYVAFFLIAERTRAMLLAACVHHVLVHIFHEAFVPRTEWPQVLTHKTPDVGTVS